MRYNLIKIFLKNGNMHFVCARARVCVCGVPGACRTPTGRCTCVHRPIGSRPRRGAPGRWSPGRRPCHLGRRAQRSSSPASRRPEDVIRAQSKPATRTSVEKSTLHTSCRDGARQAPPWATARTKLKADTPPFRRAGRSAASLAPPRAAGSGAGAPCPPALRRMSSARTAARTCNAKNTNISTGRTTQSRGPSLVQYPQKRASRTRRPPRSAPPGRAAGPRPVGCTPRWRPR